MSRSTLASGFVDSVVRRAMLPITQNALTSDDILAFANEEMDNSMLPMVLQYHEDFLLSHELVPTVMTSIRYPIPYRATGNKLCDISFVDSGGGVYEMTRLNIGDESIFSNYASAYNNRTYIKQFYVEGDEIVLAVSENTQIQPGWLKFSYYMRPNLFVHESRVATILSINNTTGQITTTAALPANITSTSKIDIVKAKTPHKTLSFDIPLVSITTNSVTIDPTKFHVRLEVGDFICLAEESPVIQLPAELHSILQQRVACRCLEALGDQQGLQAAMIKLTDMEAKSGALIDSRVENAPQKVRNYHGFLANRRYPYSRW
jgi:hypothetical protein